MGGSVQLVGLLTGGSVQLPSERFRIRHLEVNWRGPLAFKCLRVRSTYCKAQRNMLNTSHSDLTTCASSVTADTTDVCCRDLTVTVAGGPGLNSMTVMLDDSDTVHYKSYTRS